MSVYVIAQGRVEDRDKLNAYAGQAAATIAAHGGKVVAFDESPQVVEGPLEHPRTVMLEFESQAAFDAWYNSPEYQAALPLRLESTVGTLIVVQGVG